MNHCMLYINAIAVLLKPGSVLSKLEAKVFKPTEQLFPHIEALLDELSAQFGLDGSVS